MLPRLQLLKRPILSTPVDSRLNRCCLQRRVEIVRIIEAEAADGDSLADVGLEYVGERGQFGAADRRNRNAGVDGIGGREQHIHQEGAADEDSRRGLQCLTFCAHYQHPAAPSSRPANPHLWQAEEGVQASSCKKPEDPEAAESVASSRDKALVRDVARSIVSVSSVALDGRVRHQGTGIVIGWKETKTCARVLTSSEIVDKLGPDMKLHIVLPNRTILEGQLLFFNKYYNIALLEISSELDLPLQLPSFGSNPNYGQEVFILARGKDSNLMARQGRVLWFEDPEHLNRNYLMSFSCDISGYGTGGLVIDHEASSVIGMTFDDGGPNLSILAISTILTCIEMWMKFSRIARPVHGLSLRTVELLEVSLQEVISFDHNINNGYIVDEVSIGSTAEKLGVKYGDVIVSFDGLRDQTLPQLEDYLLSLGWGFLQGSTDSSSTVDLKLEVYDLLERGTRSLTLSVEFCDASE